MICALSVLNLNKSGKFVGGKHEADWDADCAADGEYVFSVRYEKYCIDRQSGFVYASGYDHGKHSWDNWDAIKELGEELTEVSERMSA